MFIPNAAGIKQFNQFKSFLYNQINRYEDFDKIKVEGLNVKIDNLTFTFSDGATAEFCINTLISYFLIQTSKGPERGF